MIAASPKVMEAIERFRCVPDRKSLWETFEQELRTYGFTESLYVFDDALEHKRMGDLRYSKSLLYSYPEEYMATKDAIGGFYDDFYWEWCGKTTVPLLWSDTSYTPTLSEEEAKSLEIDWDFDLITGVTIPFQFNDGWGRGATGLNAAGTQWCEFALMWQENSEDILAIASAFDICMREGHIGEIFPLSMRERECLLWLAAGLRPQQIADRFHTHEKTVEKQIASARHKLKADTVPQAVAKALIFGLITP